MRAEQTVDVTPSLGRYTPSEDGGYGARDAADLSAVPVCFPRSGAWTHPSDSEGTSCCWFSHVPTHQWQSGGNEVRRELAHACSDRPSQSGLYPDSRGNASRRRCARCIRGQGSDRVTRRIHPIALGDNVKRFCDAVMQFCRRIRTALRLARRRQPIRCLRFRCHRSEHKAQNRWIVDQVLQVPAKA